MARLKVTNIHTPFGDEDPDSSGPGIFVGGTGRLDNSDIMIDIKPGLHNVFDDALGLACQGINNNGRGCSGQIYLRAVEDNVSVDVTVVGPTLDRLSRDQAQAIVVSYFESPFLEGCLEMDAFYMRELIKSFTPEAPDTP